MRVDDFVIRPQLNELIGYNSNVIGTSQSPGSWFLQTAPSVSAESNWSRNRLGAFVSLDNTSYFQTPKQNTTDVVASVAEAIDRAQRSHARLLVYVPARATDRYRRSAHDDARTLPGQ